ncbi:DUF6083 domain-containing protein [Streptomyces sp. NPDC001093]|uniref:DUF6083 domain-containing protein n=1 Tax=Streptomyces sp. NPDC001093 TaxID=3154376 RepID=UPI00332B5507
MSARTLDSMGAYDSIIPLPGPGPDGHRQPPTGTPQPWEKADLAQAMVDGATGPEPPAPPLCPNCGLPGERRLTYTRRHVLLEPRLILPGHLVPGGHRWYIDSSSGRAWNAVLDEPFAGARCRIPHRLACPGLTLDEVQPWTWLTKVRELNALKARQQSDEGGYAGELSDTG